MTRWDIMILYLSVLFVILIHKTNII